MDPGHIQRTRNEKGTAAGGNEILYLMVLRPAELKQRLLRWNLL
jgi:hypothetical protein